MTDAAPEDRRQAVADYLGSLTDKELTDLVTDARKADPARRVQRGRDLYNAKPGSAR